MTATRVLVLGGGEGWHGNQLADAARRAGCELSMATYESLRSHIAGSGEQETAARDTGRSSENLRNVRHARTQFVCDAGPIDDFDVVLTRTMPAGSMEQITFRLAILHVLHARGVAIVNPPRSLEIAIDKFATLALLSDAGYVVPETRVVQSRESALRAFHELGGDCVVKPLFGGEGRGVMRIQDPQLAWYAFASLEQLGAVFYVQRFVGPGGRDTRYLVIGDDVYAIRRENTQHFRTNVSVGGQSRRIEPSEEETARARDIASRVGLSFGSVDFIDSDEGPLLLEVNAIPGWKGAQSVVQENLADKILRTLVRASRNAEVHVGS